MLRLRTRLRRLLSRVAHYLAALPQRRPTIELQSETADCGYICISAVMALLDRPTLVHEVKERAGTTSRGLTLRQLRDGLRACGAEVDAVSFDRTRAISYPCPGIVLLSRGHYIVIARRAGDSFEVYDPQFGWAWMSRRKLARSSDGLGVLVRGLSASAKPAKAPILRSVMSRQLRQILTGRSARAAMATFAAAEILTLALPLLSMWSVDRSVTGLSIGILGAIGIGFVALSLTNIVISLAGELMQSKMKRNASVALSRIAFDSLAGKSPYWFELGSSASLQNRVGSLYTQLNFHLEVVHAIASLVVTFAIGLAALLFISPWLLVPGACALVLSVVLDLLFERSQRNHFAAVVETAQRRQAFVLDTLSQLPLIARFGALIPARVKFASLVRGAASSEAHLQSLRGWRTALGGLSKSGETLFFVTVSAAFMASGDFTIGGFVALGAYKDLLAGAVGTVFNLTLRRRSLAVHRLQAAPLLTSDRFAPPTQREIVHGEVVFNSVSFAYGTLDRPVFDGLDLHVRPGECTVIRGPSGSGKSTISKLLVAALSPTGGTITIDGLPLAESMPGMAAVLQSDRLIDGTIKDNVLLFRRDVPNSEIMGALKAAAVDDFVGNLPMGLSTRVGEGLSGLSGGQRQRLLIARAALSKPRLIILDEATSSLEVEVEARILTALRSRGATMILLAHRPEVWALADRIYTLDGDGRLCDESSCRNGALEPHSAIAMGNLVPGAERPSC